MNENSEVSQNESISPKDNDCSEELQIELTPTNKVLIKKLLPQHDHRLYGQILKSKDSTHIVNDWLSNYSVNKEEAIYNLYQLYVDLSSYQHIDVNKFVESQDISQLITNMDYSKNNILCYTSKYFLIMHNKTYRTKLSKIENFIIKFIELCNKGKILYDCILFYKLIDFFVQMSKSNVRATRHTGVYFALKHQTGFVYISSKIIEKMDSLQKSYDTEQDEQLKDRLEQKMEILKNYNEVVNKMISFLQEKIFKKNWNLMDPRLYYMREECISELFHWMEIYPSRYVQMENLNLIIKSISDPNKQVRSSAIITVGKIIDNFTSLIQQSMLLKLIEPIAKHVRDVDYKVSILAVDTLTIVRRSFSLPSHIREMLCMNIYNIHYPLAAACGKYLVELMINKNKSGDEGLLRLLILFNQKAIDRGLKDSYPLLIESIYDHFPVLQDVKVFMNVLDENLIANETAADIWLNILTESCQQTFVGKCSLERNKGRKGIVNQEKIKEMVKELIKSLSTLISVFGLNKLTDLLLLMKNYTPKDAANNYILN